MVATGDDSFWSLLTLWALGWGGGSVFIFPPPEVVSSLFMLLLYSLASRLQRWASREASRGDTLAAVCNLLPIYLPFLQSLNQLLVLLALVSSGVLACQLCGSGGVLRPIHIPLNVARVWLLEVCTHTPVALFLQPVITPRAFSLAFNSTGLAALLPSLATLILSLAFWDVDGSESTGDSSLLKDLSGSLPRLVVAAYQGVVALLYLFLLATTGGRSGGSSLTSIGTSGSSGWWRCFGTPHRPSLRPYAWAVLLSRTLVVVGLLVSAWQPDEEDFSVAAYDTVLYALVAVITPLCLYASLDAETAFWRGDLRGGEGGAAGGGGKGAVGVGGALRVWLSLLLFCFRGKGYSGYGGGLRGIPVPPSTAGGLKSGALPHFSSSQTSKGGEKGVGGTPAATLLTPLLLRPTTGTSGGGREGAVAAASGSSGGSTSGRMVSSRNLARGTSASGLTRGTSLSNLNRATALARGLRNWMMDSMGLSLAGDEELLPSLMELLEEASSRNALLDFSYLSQTAIVDSGNDAAVFKGTCVTSSRGGVEDFASPLASSPSPSPSTTPTSHPHSHHSSSSGGGGGRAVLHDVAIKVFKPPLTGLTSETLRKIAGEASINMLGEGGGLKRRVGGGLGGCGIRYHPPVVPFLGVCNCPPDISLITEWCSGGTLRAWLDGEVRRRSGGGSSSSSSSSQGKAATTAPPVRYLHPTTSPGALGDGGTDPITTLASSHCDPTWGWVVGVTREDIQDMPLSNPEVWPLGDIGGLESVWGEERDGGGGGGSSPQSISSGDSSPVVLLQHHLSPFTLQRLLLAMDAAAALAYMASFAPLLAHRDIKSLNFFLAPTIRTPQTHSTSDGRVSGAAATTTTSTTATTTPSLQALLGDFGDAVSCTRGLSSLKVERGTLAYMAPEVSVPYWGTQLKSDGLGGGGGGTEGEEVWVEGGEVVLIQEENDSSSSTTSSVALSYGGDDEEVIEQGIAYDHRCDVYGLALVLWEVVTGGSPFSTLQKNSLLRKYVHGLHARPIIPPHTPRAIAHLMRTGWHPDPARRPSARVFARVLERCVEEACRVRGGGK